MARELPGDGALVTLEINPTNAAIAQRNLERAGVAGRTTVLLAPASESLQRLISDRTEPFDLVFIDADKERSVEYFDAALALTRIGSTIIVDNVVRAGKVADASSDDPDIQGIRRMTEWIAHQPHVSATAIQTVGGKSYDGFLMAIVGERG